MPKYYRKIYFFLICSHMGMTETILDTLKISYHTLCTDIIYKIRAKPYRNDTENEHNQLKTISHKHFCNYFYLFPFPYGISVSNQEQLTDCQTCLRLHCTLGICL